MTDQAAKPLFDLNPTDEQALMRETVRKFANTEMRSISRKADEAGEAPAGFYAKCLELGFNMVPISEELGGMGVGRSPIGNVLLAEDLATGDMSLAIGAMSSLSFINAIIDNGTAEQQKALLPAFTGEALHTGTVALMERKLQFDPAKLATKARKDGNGWVISGEKTMVALAETADVFLVIADVEGEGPQAFIVNKGHAGVSLEREQYMGLRPLQLSRMKLNDVQLGADARIGGTEKSFNLERFVDLGRIGVAALTLGVGQAVLDYVKNYCNERTAFGEPISHRQSVAFMIADIAIELDGLRMLVYRAASRAEQGLTFHREAYLARVQAADKGMKIGTDGVQLLGGHGFIREHMVELWYRNLRAIGLLEGTVVV